MLADHASELLRYAPAVKRLRDGFWMAPNLSDYDYVLIVQPDRVKTPLGVTEVARGQGFIMTRVNR